VPGGAGEACLWQLTWQGENSENRQVGLKGDITRSRCPDWVVRHAIVGGGRAEGESKVLFERQKGILHRVEKGENKKHEKQLGCQEIIVEK